MSAPLPPYAQPSIHAEFRRIREVSHEKLGVFREIKKDSELARLSTYGAQEKLRSKKYRFHREKVKAMLLEIEVMLLHAEVMPLQMEAKL